MAKSKQQGWLDKYADGGNISGPKVPPIKLNGTEVYEHGEDTATADHEENGVEPTDLTKKGIKYAKAIGKQAAQQGKKAVISSDIERAVQTAGVMADEAGMQHTTNPLLRTWNIGDYDGKPEGSFKEKQWVKIPDKAVPGGESFDSFKDRMEKAYEMVKAAPKSDDIITHSKVTRAFKALEATDGHWTDNTTKKFQQLKDEPKKENGGWLDRFEQGGRLLEKKADNYGKHGNYNDAQASTGPDFVGLGYNTKGRDYSPAWGGQFQNGGFLQPNSYKLPSAVAIPNRPDILSSELATSIGGEDGEPAYLIPSFKGGKRVNALEEYKRTGEHLGGPFKTWQEADKWEQEVRHPYVEKGQSIPSPYKTWGDMQFGGNLPGATGMMYARTQNPAPSNGKYAKKTKASAQNGQEMQFYQNGLDWTPKTISENGSVIKDDRGQWAHPGEITEIGSNNITMQGVNYPVLGVSDTGDTKLMKPGKDYKFKGKKVTEYPQAQNGWLSKYEQQPGAPSQSDIEKRLALEKNIKDQKAANAQPTISQYTPKAGDQERMNAARDAYRADEAKPLNRAASSKYAANAMENIVEPMVNIEMAMGAGKLAKPALEAVGKHLTEETVLKNAHAFERMDDLMRISKLPKTNNEDVLNVLNDFKERIKTPEGQRRLKELGLNNDKSLQNIEIYNDPNTYGSYGGFENKIYINPDLDPNLSKTVARHEIEHGVQNAYLKSKVNELNKWYNNFPWNIQKTNSKKFDLISNSTTDIDKILGNLELRREATPNKVWDRNVNNEPVNVHNFSNLLSDKQKATDYFLTGSEGQEKSAFAGEAQQYMLDHGYIKHPYEYITPEKVQEVMADSYFDKENPIRLFQIMKNTSGNHKIVADALNKMLAVPPIAAAAATLTNSEKKQIGGWLNKYK